MKKSKLKPFDVDAFLEEVNQPADPMEAREIGELIRLFLDAQRQIGIRQFAERCGVRKQRLVAIIGGAGPTDAEMTAITTLFTQITARNDRRVAQQTIKTHPHVTRLPAHGTLLD